MKRSTTAAAHRDLFDPPIKWTPPKEFAEFLAEREAKLEVVAEPAAPVPAWAVEAATAAPPAPRRRVFDEAHERVWDGDLVVIRERGTDGHHTYRAFELAGEHQHRVNFRLGELTYGRIDTRRSPRKYDPYSEYAELVAWELECSAAAHAVIRQLCAETRREADEQAVHAGVYEGPGYVLVTVDPARRHQAVLAKEVPR